MRGPRTVGTIVTILLTLFNTGYGLFAWLAASDICTGTLSVTYWGSRLCESGGLYALLFILIQGGLLAGVLFLLARASSRPLVYAALLSLYVLYSVGIILLVYRMWSLPFFLQPLPGHHIPAGL